MTHDEGYSDAARPETRPPDDGQRAEQARRLRRSLVRELIQAETAARLHCSREAKRLGQVPPAVPMLAASLHADKALRGLLQHAPDQPTVMVGSVSGTLVSALRQAMMDYAQSGEQAYRSTLLGLRHGIDVVTVLHRLALREADVALAAWCEEWLGLRMPVVGDAHENLAWFAENLGPATETSRPLLKRQHPQAA